MIYVKNMELFLQYYIHIAFFIGFFNIRNSIRQKALNTGAIVSFFIKNTFRNRKSAIRLMHLSALKTFAFPEQGKQRSGSATV
jgi:hypothetical protein